MQITREIGRDLIAYVEYQYDRQDFYVGFDYQEKKSYIGIKNDKYFFEGINSDLKSNSDLLEVVTTLLKASAIVVNVNVISTEFYERERQMKHKAGRFTYEGFFRLKGYQLQEIVKLYHEITKPLELRTVEDVETYLEHLGFLEY